MSLLDEVMGNIERIGKGNLSTGGDVTGMESYDPSQRVGPENDFSRDFYAGQGTTTEIPAGMRDVISPGETLPMPGNLSADVWNVGAGNAGLVVDAPASSFSTTQALLVANAGAVQVLQDRPRRASVVVYNTSQGAGTIYIGRNSSVTVNSGFPIVPGSTFTMAVNCGLWAVSDANVVVACMEFLY